MNRNEKWHRDRRIGEINKELNVLLHNPDPEKKKALYKELKELRNR